MGWGNTLLHQVLECFQSYRQFSEKALQRWLYLDYKYEPSLPIGSIRVLGLLPGETGDPIRCTLETKTLDEAEDSYEAISYCWGLKPEVLIIHCNGRRLSITHNLFDALKQFRDPKQIRHLWADAVCINQQDDLEKAQQVKRMGSVFEKASRVIAWLGRDDAYLANDCFTLVRDTVAYLDGEYVSNGHKYFSPLEPNSCPINTDQERWDGVRALLNMGWFERAWVVQEAGLGKDCILNWGPYSMPLVDLVELAYFSAWRADLSLFTGDLGPSASSILDSFNYIQSGYNNPQSWHAARPVLSWRNARYASELFINTVLASRKLKALDSRDYVYAFLGSPLAFREDGNLMVEPDYSRNKTPEDVFVETAMALLKNRKEAPWVLLYVDHRSEDDLQGRYLPSWVPRWDPWEYNGLSECVYWYRAGGKLDAFHSDVSEDAHHLTLDGYLFDQIMWISKPIRGDSFGFNPAQRTSQYFREASIDDLWTALVEIAGRSDKDFHDSFLLCLVRAFPFSQGLSTIDKDRLRTNFRAYQTYLRGLSVRDDPHPSPQEDHNPWAMLSHLRDLDNKRLIFTKAGHLGVVPPLSRLGDVCCMSFGLASPLILRASVSDDGIYNLVGGAYINDVMNGELLEKAHDGRIRKEIIKLA